jgi:hypothetical protein
MSDKVIVTGIAVINEPDPWDVGMVTERLPAQELYDDGIEPEDSSLPYAAGKVEGREDSLPEIKRDRAA